MALDKETGKLNEALTANPLPTWKKLEELVDTAIGVYNGTLHDGLVALLMRFRYREVVRRGLEESKELSLDSALLTEMAMRLTDDFRLPAAEERG